MTSRILLCFLASGASSTIDEDGTAFAVGPPPILDNNGMWLLHSGPGLTVLNQHPVPVSWHMSSRSRRQSASSGWRISVQRPQ